MKPWKGMIFVIGILGFSSVYAQVQSFPLPQTTAIPGEYIVVSRNSPSDNPSFSLVHTDQVKPSQTLQTLNESPNLDYIQPNFLYTLFSVPNDPLFAQSRGLYNTGQTVNSQAGTSGADSKWLAAYQLFSGINDPLRTGGLIAIIDNGVDYTHPDLVHQSRDGTSCLSYTGVALGGCQGGFDFVGNDVNPLPNTGDWHGTHVSGIIGAEGDNGSGSIGVAPHSRLMRIRSGSGQDLETLDIVRGIQFAALNGAKVINASRGGYSYTCASGYDQSLYTALRDFPGLIIAAAGNNTHEHTSGFYSIPADYAVDTPCRSGLQNIISVAASTAQDQLASFSDWSSSRIAIAAPGENIFSSVPGAQYGYADGTSMSAPFVAGAVALARDMRPDLGYMDIKQALLTQADTIPALSGKVVGGRRLNIYRTLQFLEITPIEQLHIFTFSGQEEILSGAYMSGNQIFAQRSPPISTGTLSGYVLQATLSGQTIMTTVTQSTGISFAILQDGLYSFSVWPVFVGGTTGSILVSSRWRDTLAPSTPGCVRLCSGDIVGADGIALAWSPSIDTGVGMASGVYTYTLSHSGSLVPTLTGISTATGITLSLSDRDSYQWQVQASDGLGNQSPISSGWFVLNIPDAFTFPARNGVELSMLTTSDPIIISGLMTGSSVSVLGGNYSINSGAYTNVSGQVVSGDTLRVQQTSSSSYSASTTLSLVIGGLTGNFVVTTKAAPVSNGGGGGGGGGGGSATTTLPDCTAQQLVCQQGAWKIVAGVSCQNTKADVSCASASSSGAVSSGSTVKIVLLQHILSPYSSEVISGYLFAYGLGITTVPDIIQARLLSGLIRKDLAKMMVNFVIHELHKTPNTGLNCSFADMGNETVERQTYARLACQMGLMGVDGSGQANIFFSPNGVVTRAQFATTLSRALRGTTFNGGISFYTNHLLALQKANIIKTNTDVSNQEKRGLVFLMLMRAATYLSSK